MTVLLVDDDPDILDSLKPVLEVSLGDVEILTAGSAFEGLQVLAGHTVNLIVTDFKMPGMNGVEFLAEAKKLAPSVPHILMTAFNRELSRELGLRPEDETVLSKPLDPDGIVRCIRKALDRARGSAGA